VASSGSGCRFRLDSKVLCAKVLGRKYPLTVDDMWEYRPAMYFTTGSLL
jgi:hypothetical protein